MTCDGESVIFMTVQYVTLHTCSSVTAQTDASEQTTTSVTVTMTVVMGLMNQSTAVSDVCVYPVVIQIAQPRWSTCYNTVLLLLVLQHRDYEARMCTAGVQLGKT